MRRLIKHISSHGVYVNKHTRRFTKHVKKHKHYYAFGTFGMFAIVKAVLFFAGFLGLGSLFAQTPVELNSTNITEAPFSCAIDATECTLSYKNI